MHGEAWPRKDAEQSEGLDGGELSPAELDTVVGGGQQEELKKGASDSKQKALASEQKKKASSSSEEKKKSEQKQKVDLKGSSEQKLKKLTP